MATVDDFALPYLSFEESASPDNPGAGIQRLFLASSNGELYLRDSGGTEYRIFTSTTAPEDIGLACSDETTAIDSMGIKNTFRMPYDATLDEVLASLTNATTTGTFTVDVHKNGVTVLSTKVTIDATEKTSVTAATGHVISDSSLLKDDEITIEVDDTGDNTATGLKVWLLFTRA